MRADGWRAVPRWICTAARSRSPALEDGWGVREARAFAGIGETQYWLAEFGAATEALDRAIAAGAELGDDWTLALALRFRGDIAINVDADLDVAEALLARSVEAAEALAEPWAIARSLLFQGWVPWTRDQYGDVRRDLAPCSRDRARGR